jgi:hypothetical protein
MDALSVAPPTKRLCSTILLQETRPSPLTELTAKKITRIEELISSCRATPCTTAVFANAKLVAQLRATIKGKWAPSGFCSMHG